MDDIRRMLDRLSDLSDQELEQLEESIINEFGTIEKQEISRESVADMTFLADSIDNVRAERGKREAERTELAAQATEAAARITDTAAEASAGSGSEAEEEEEEEEGEGEPPEEFAAAETTETPEPVTASTETPETAEPAEPGTELAAEPATEPATEPAAELAAEPTAEPAAELAAGADDDEDAADETIAEAIAEETGGPVEEMPVTDEPETPSDTNDTSDTEEEEPVFAARGDQVGTESAEAHMGDNAAGTTFSAPADRLPVKETTTPNAPISLVAGGDIPGITAGSELSGKKGLAEAMSLRLHTLRRASGGRGDQVVVASLMAQFPEERTLRGNELDSNSDKITAITAPNAVVASGGWCAPLPVNYDIFDIGGSTDTPLKDSLPVFNADRGGVRFIKPPVLDDYAGAVAIWTNQDDIDAATDPAKRKACLTVQCAEEDEVYLDAVTMCMCFGNLQTRAFPELIDRHNQLALVEAARFAEIYVLNKLKELSTAVALPAVLGTARDTLVAVERAATAYRHQHRLDPKLPLRFVAPQWLHAMIRSDLTAQLPGDGMETTFNVADATIDSFFNQRNIRPVWTLDGIGELPTVTDYPDTVEWGLFAEGTFTLLDGGTLDIGLVRDMDLVASNDYCMFTEQFMAVAKTGLDSLWVTQTMNVNGGSAGTLDVAMVDY